MAYDYLNTSRFGGLPIARCGQPSVLMFGSVPNVEIYQPRPVVDGGVPIHGPGGLQLTFQEVK